VTHFSQLLFLAALVFVPACQSSSSSGGGDTDTGSDTNTDTDTDSDIDVDGGCPGPIVGPCDFFEHPLDVLISSDEAAAFLGVEATRFEKMITFKSDTYGVDRVAVLVSILEAEQYAETAVLLIDLEAYADEDELVMTAAVGSEIDVSLRPRALVRPRLEEHVSEWDVLVVLCPAEFDCSFYGMPVLTEGVGQLEFVTSAAVDEASAPVGFAALETQYLLFGETVWHSPSLDTWESGTGVADGEPIADVYFRDNYETMSTVAVGAAGRLLRWNGAGWSELAAVTDSDLNSVTGWSAVSTAWFFAGGDDGVLIDNTTGELRACTVMEADITAVGGWVMKHAVVVGAADGSVSYLWYDDYSCLIMSGEQPVLEVSMDVLGEDTLLFLMLTADALTVQRHWVFPEE